MNTISVVIPIKNRFDLAKIAFMSVVNQTSRPSQIIIVDDGSDVCAAVALNHEIIYARSVGILVDIIINKYSLGVSVSRNKGIECADGEFIAFCDSDDYWLPQKLEYLLKIIISEGADIVVHAFSWVIGSHWVFKILRFGSVFVIPRPLLAMFFFLNVSCCIISRKLIGSKFSQDFSFHEDLDYFLTLSERSNIHFVNFSFMCMGRPPGSVGGLTENHLKMTEGAIAALKKCNGGFVFKLCAKAKMIFTKFMYYLYLIK